MSKSPNNHHSERTTTVAVSVREEVSRAIGSTLPDKQKNEVIARVSQIAERYSSPYPDSDYLAEIEKLSPGATKDIIAASIVHMANCHENDMKELSVKEKEIDLVDRLTKRDLESVKHGRVLGTLCFIILLLFSGFMHWIGAQTLSYVAFGASVLGIISQIIGGKSGLVSIVRKSPPNTNQ